MHSKQHTVAFIIAASCCAISAPAFADHAHRRVEREYGAEGSYRVGGYGDRIYPPAYDGARAYYGGRHDNRWRWTDTTPSRGNDNDLPYQPFAGVPLSYSGYGLRW